jgi:hypothetical protein
VYSQDKETVSQEVRRLALADFEADVSTVASLSHYIPLNPHNAYYFRCQILPVNKKTWEVRHKFVQMVNICLIL